MPPEVSMNDVYQTFTLTSNNRNQFRFRTMQENDIAIVVDIERITWPTQSWSSEDFYQYFDDPRWVCWIIESTTNNHQLLGFGIQNLSNGVSHIANLCIHPDQRGRGLGKMLLRHMIDYACLIGALSVSLEVDPQNTPAYTLYANHGFRIHRYIPQYYSDTSDAYEMTLLV